MDRTAQVGLQQQAKLLVCLTCSPTQIPLRKESRQHCQYLVREVRTFTVQSGPATSPGSLCGEKEVLTKPGLARGGCQQVKLARTPVASCLWPSPVGRSGYRGDIVLSIPQGAVESLCSAKSHDSS